jgi:hypothetical protein
LHGKRKCSHLLCGGYEKCAKKDPPGVLITADDRGYGR